MDDEALATLRGVHREDVALDEDGVLERWPSAAAKGKCAECGDPWPCAVAALVAEMDRLRRWELEEATELLALREEVSRLREENARLMIRDVRRMVGRE